MVSGGNSLQTMPLDIVAVFLKMLLSTGFESFYTFLKAWSQSERSLVISQLLERLPIQSLYKFGNIGTSVDIACFHRFIGVGVELGIADAIVYARCRDLICMAGNFDASFAVLSELARSGKFLAKVTHFILSVMYGRHTSVSGLEALVDMHRHPHYRRQIGDAVASIEVVLSSVAPSSVVAEVPNRICCPIHSMFDGPPFLDRILESEMCFFCENSCIFNRFTNKVKVPVPMQ